MFAGAAMGVSFSIAFGVAMGVAFGVAVGVSMAVSMATGLSIIDVVAVGVAFGVAFGVAMGLAFDVAKGIFAGVIVGVGMIVFLNVIGGMTFAVTFIITFLRLPMYLWELPRSLHLSGRATRAAGQAAMLWRKQPLHYDEVIQLPLVGLPEHIAAIARSDPEAALEALADVGASLRQGWAVPQALTLILYAELRRGTTPALIARFAEATHWLPAESFADDEQPLLQEFRSISQDTAGALAAATREASEQGLRAQIERLRNRRTSLSRSERAHLRGYAETLEQWQRVLEAEAAQVREQRTQIGELPVRYIAGMVLPTGTSSFYGRDDLFRELEDLLVNSPGKVTPLLLGQPRTGKTSALRQLPQRLGAQVLPVYLDMERRATATDAFGLVSDLAHEIRAAAQRHPQPISLPPLEEQMIAGDPYRVFENWIDEVEQAIGERRRLLLTLDEFNRIDRAVQNNTMDERIFFMLRSLIQHHPRVLLALCGTFTLEESDPRWYEALKSSRTLPVTYLRRNDARRFFIKPAPDFPDEVYQPAAVERVLELTNGHPLFLHLIGERVVSAYNRNRQDIAPGTPPGTPLPVSAIEAAIPEVFASGETAFVSIWQWILRISGNAELTTHLLRALARGEALAAIGDPDARAELLELFCERDLLYPDGAGSYTYQVPLIAHWIARRRRLPRVG